MPKQPRALPRPLAGDDSAAKLTPTQARLLAVLRGAPGRAFTRRELTALVMPRSIVLERTIDVHVKSLRRKMGAAGEYIETVRGVGYRFRENKA